ncbi:hypothetical protein SARC_07092 [Sphaeroforma arctica JP610]|uniref:Hemimethylated DNA-binding domain-containing protein n=1 Tax=Sphaeroforma arctica JP610 TaxID=667725 RepID=A0A0L0FUL5_9EUKA|nr:hypothetical protein SARC_07092 [Sphaeroforma arctica JP610]KNC80545.1 hypothetical protein SARC_07092 [Sphaeroforma arctica JP610]|eukprot:XP_014154447.1 hypothetical protein SARC_07092 [Sphaeroforma arctica JP610]
MFALRRTALCTSKVPMRTMLFSTASVLKSKPILTDCGKVDKFKLNDTMKEGDFFVQKSKGLRAVVLRVDSTFSATQHQPNADSHTEEEKKQTFYLALPDERDTLPEQTRSSLMIYVPQSDVLPFYSYLPIQHSHSSTYMKGFANGRHELHSDFYCLF